MPDVACFHVIQLIYADCPHFLTSVADKTALEAYLKFPPCALGYFRVTLTTSHTIHIDQDRIPNTFQQTGHRWHQLTCSHQTKLWTTIITSCYLMLLLGTLKEVMTNQGNQIRHEVNCQNAPWIISSDTSTMALIGSRWCNGMPTRHLSTRWNCPIKFLHHSNICSWKMVRKGGNQRRINHQIWDNIVHAAITPRISSQRSLAAYIDHTNPRDLNAHYYQDTR